MKKNIPVLAIILTLATASYAWAQSLTDGLVTKVDASAAKDHHQARADEKVRYG